MAKVLFLDESGDHSLTKIHASHPVFVLCGVIMDDTYHEDIATARLNLFKEALFGANDIVLHTADFAQE